MIADTAQRILIARGRDAADVAISTTFGRTSLKSFVVTTRQAEQEALSSGETPMTDNCSLSLSETYALKYWRCSPPRTGIASVRPAGRTRSTCKNRSSGASISRFAVAVSRFGFAVGTAAQLARDALLDQSRTVSAPYG